MHKKLSKTESSGKEKGGAEIVNNIDTFPPLRLCSEDLYKVSAGADPENDFASIRHYLKIRGRLSESCLEIVSVI